MSSFTAFLDTNVLVPASIRDLLMQLTTTGVFRAKWSQLVMDELRTVLVDRQGKPADKVERMMALMLEHASDPPIASFESQSKPLPPSQPKSRSGRTSHTCPTARRGRVVIRLPRESPPVGRP